MDRIKQGDIWLISFDPSIGNEIQKTRPAIVISNSYYNLASGTIFVVPITSKKPKLKNYSALFAEIPKSNTNNLSNHSYVNITQLRAVSKLRFVKKIGEESMNKIDEVFMKFAGICDINLMNLRY